MLNQENAMDLIELTAAELNISKNAVEKDWWMCWTLNVLFSLPDRMVFKGGTSLSKIFNVIQRYSEDIDITIDSRKFILDLDLQNMSRTQLKRTSEKLKQDLSSYLQFELLPHLNMKYIKAFPNSEGKFILRNNEQISFYYQSVLPEVNPYLRESILIEFGIRNSTDPSEKHLIQPFIAKFAEEFKLNDFEVDVLSPIRTFWEKATLIHVECSRERLIETPQRMSRHWYDLFMLQNSVIGKEALKRFDILENVILFKKAFYNASYAYYDECLNGNFKLVPNQNSIIGLKNDFLNMFQAGMFSEDPQSLDEIISSLLKLEQEINAKILNNT